MYIIIATFKNLGSRYKIMIEDDFENVFTDEDVKKITDKLNNQIKS